MFFGLDLLASKDLFDDAFFINDKGGSDGAKGLLTIHHLLTPGTHRFHQHLIDIGNQREGQLMLLLELNMRGC